MRALVPTLGPTGFRKEMERLFDRFWDLDLPEIPAYGEWSPMLDVREKGNEITVKAEVPGIDPKDIRVTVREDLLTIAGEKREEKEEKDEHVYRRERNYGAFSRTIRLPASVDGSKVTARFKNGLLAVVLPKVPAKDGSAIPIKVE